MTKKNKMVCVVLMLLSFAFLVMGFVQMEKEGATSHTETISAEYANDNNYINENDLPQELFAGSEINSAFTDNSEKIVESDKADMTMNILLDGETVRLNAEQLISAVENKNYCGSGYLIWDKWTSIKNGDLLSGLIDVDLLSDEVYTSMKLPSEASDYFLQYRVNASIIHSSLSGRDKACGIAAFYPVYNATLPDKFNLYVGKFMTFILRYGDDTQWEALSDSPYINNINSIQLRPLPWTTKVELKSTRPIDKTIFGQDYVKFELLKEDLYDRENNDDGSVLHFYSKKEPISSDEVRACVVIYEMWSDTEGIDGSIVATVGFDFWDDSSCQVFSGHSYLVTNEHRKVIGHNIPDELYYELIQEGKSPHDCLSMFDATE